MPSALNDERLWVWIEMGTHGNESRTRCRYGNALHGSCAMLASDSSCAELT